MYSTEKQYNWTNDPQGIGHKIDAQIFTDSISSLLVSVLCSSEISEVAFSDIAKIVTSSMWATGIQRWQP